MKLLTRPGLFAVIPHGPALPAFDTDITDGNLRLAAQHAASRQKQ